MAKSNTSKFQSVDIGDLGEAILTSAARYSSATYDSYDMQAGLLKQIEDYKREMKEKYSQMNQIQSGSYQSSPYPLWHPSRTVSTTTGTPQKSKPTAIGDGKFVRVLPNIVRSAYDDVFYVINNDKKYCTCSSELLTGIEDIETADDPVAEYNAKVAADSNVSLFLQLTDEAYKKSELLESNYLARFKPSKIKAYLDEFVAGQEEAKKILSVAAWNHVLRNHLAKKGGSNGLIKKTNVVLVGPTGCGKTYLCEVLAKYLAMPIYIGDATELTPDGYVGTDCADFVSRLFDASGQDKEKTETGIIVIDEVDKLASAQAQSGSMQNNRKSYAIGGSVKGIGTQQALLKLVEGKKTTTNQGGGLMSTKAPMPEIDTSRILFIIAGAFSGITHELGFDGRISTDDLVNYGLMPEFVGRFPLIGSLTPLDLACLTEIVWKPKGSLVAEYKAMFQAMKIELLFTQSALKAIAGKAIVKGTGARGLRGIIENALFELMYEAPDWDARTVVVTERAIEGKEKPLINPEVRGEAWI